MWVWGAEEGTAATAELPFALGGIWGFHLCSEHTESLPPQPAGVPGCLYKNSTFPWTPESRKHSQFTPSRHSKLAWGPISQWSICSSPSLELQRLARLGLMDLVSKPESAVTSQGGWALGEKKLLLGFRAPRKSFLQLGRAPDSPTPSPNRFGTPVNSWRGSPFSTAHLEKWCA